MPLLIQCIDAIARQKGRDVLWVHFGEVDDAEESFCISEDEDSFLGWENNPQRIDLIAWLDTHGIGWCPCEGFASENCMCSYQGDIYIDLPFDRADPVYQELSEHLENPDETRKIPGVTFCYLPLKSAMRNAHHDEPGFWEKWAENF